MSSILRNSKKKIIKNKLKKSNIIQIYSKNIKIRDYIRFDHEGAILLFPEKNNHFFWKEIDYSNPTDMITINSKEESKLLLQKWNTMDSENFQIPADIFLNETIPLNDFILRYDLHKNNKKSYIYFRCVVYKDRKKFNDNRILVGAIIANFNKGKYQILNPISIENDTKHIMNNQSIGYRGINVEKLKNMSNNNFNKLMDYFEQTLIDWYSIEYALLNPVVKEQIKNRKIGQKNYSEIEEYEYRKNNKVVYIKRLPITIEDLIVGEKRKYEHHTDKWGVLGHWRTYKNGKKTWIKPYEKGSKRNQKLENPEIRERIIITE